MTSYNGYTNKATWNYVLWMNNDESAQREVLRMSAALKAEGLKWAGEDAQQVAAWVLGDETPDGYKADAVDWDEVAGHFAEWE